MSKNIQNRTSYNDREDLVNVISPSLKNYYKHIANLILNTPSEKRKILDFGAGCGTLTKLIKIRTKSDITCVEIDKQLKIILESNGFDVFRNFNKYGELS